MPVLRDDLRPRFDDSFAGRVQERFYADEIYNRVIDDPQEPDVCRALRVVLQTGYSYSAAVQAGPDLDALRSEFAAGLAALEAWAVVLPQADAAVVVRSVSDTAAQRRELSGTTDLAQYTRISSSIVAALADPIQQLVDKWRAECPSVNPI